MAVRLKPDQKLVFSRDWPNAASRLKGTAAILSKMAKLADAATSQSPEIARAGSN
jgi:transcription-repair coupling factor (superfamily II helicase)